MKEVRISCDRCDAVSDWGETRNWLHLDTDHSFIVIDADDGVDLCPSCAGDFEEWIVGDDELTEWGQLGMESLRNRE